MPPQGSLCGKCILRSAGSPGFPSQLRELSSLLVPCCPSFHALPIEEFFISIPPVPAAVTEQNSQPSHKPSSIAVALQYSQSSAGDFFFPLHLTPLKDKQFKKFSQIFLLSLISKNTNYTQNLQLVQGIPINHGYQTLFH